MEHGMPGPKPGSTLLPSARQPVHRISEQIDAIMEVPPVAWQNKSLRREALSSRVEVRDFRGRPVAARRSSWGQSDLSGARDGGSPDKAGTAQAWLNRSSTTITAQAQLYRTEQIQFITVPSYGCL